MFESGVAIGERVAVWHAMSVEPEPRLRVLLPGEGSSARERAMTAVFVPSVQAWARKTARVLGASKVTGTSKVTETSKVTGTSKVRTGPAQGSVGRRLHGGAAGHRRVVMPGDPTPTDTAFARFRGHPGDARPEMDRAVRLGLIDGVTQVGAAMLELGCWRTRISAMPPGPGLVTALTERPDALAPAQVSDPDEELAAAWGARDTPVGDRVVTGWANAVLESVTARARVLSWLQAEQYTDLAMLSRNYPGLAEMLPTEVGFALRTSDRTAGNAISTARTMTIRLPGTLEALRAGLIDAGHAMALASATSSTTAQVTSAVEADLLPLVTGKGNTITAEQLRRRAVRRVIALDPDGATDRHRKAREDRTMTRWAEEDGMAGLRILAPAEQIAAIWEAATGMADAAKTPWDPRTLGARRVDCLADLCHDLLTGITPTPTNPAHVGDPTPTKPAPGQPGSAATPTERRPAIPNPTCAGADAKDDADAGDGDGDGDEDRDRNRDGGDATDAVNNTAAADHPAPGDTAANDPAPGDAAAGDATADADARPSPGRVPDLPRRHGRRPHIQVLVPYDVLLGGNDPCELTGHGPITADQARAIITDGVLQRLLYDPTTGIVLDYGRTRYEPPEALKQLITARDQTCRTPGCLQPAERCQIDHVDPFRPGKPTGGPTNHTNLDAKCHHHHRAKDGGGFVNTRDPDGTTHWTTPLNRSYHLPPAQITEPINLTETDFDDRFPPELKKITDRIHRTRANPSRPPENPAETSSQDPGRPNPTDAADGAHGTNAVPFAEEPPF